MEGTHIIIDGFECNSLHLNDIGYLENLCKKVALDAGMEVLYSYFHPFEPQGVTGMLVLSTSHLSIHTWPEKRYASMDFYTCGSDDLTGPVHFLLKELAAEKAIMYTLARGTPVPQIIQSKDMSAAPEVKGEIG